MSHTTPAQVSFAAGELSEQLHCRVDLRPREIGVKKMLGWVPRLQGTAEACPGTIDQGALRGPESFPLPYVFNRTQAYIVEASAGKLRFYTNNAQIMDGGDPYEIEAPWTAEQLGELYWHQALDALYLYHPEVQTQKLSRTSATTFALTPFVYAGGPFDPRNQDKALTVSASSTSGTVTLTASAALFAATDVGRLFRMEAVDLGSIPAWDVGMTVALGDLRQSNGAIYQAMMAGKTGGVAPIHTEGVEWDGMGTADANSQVYGVQWAYLHDRYGLLRIASFSSATEVEAEVIRRLPYTIADGVNYDDVYGGGGGWYYDNPLEPDFEWTPPDGGSTGTPGTWRWQFGSFSNTSGWPQCGVIWDERHMVGFQATVHGSVIGALDDFSPLNELGDPSRDQAFSGQIPAADFIRWMVADEDLLVGTGAGEHRIGASSAAQSIGPGAVRRARQSDEGAASGMPIEVDGRVVFVQAARQKLIEFAYAVERDRFTGPDLTANSDHMGDPGFGRIAWQKEKSRLIWSERDDGTLACALYEPKQEALGWAARTLGGGLLATGVCTIPDPDGRFDQLWITTTNGDGSAGRMLRMARMRDTSDKSRNRIMTDASWIYEGAPTTSIAAPHLAGKTVDILADGLPIMEVALDGDGAAELATPASTIIVGLPFPAELHLLPLESGGDNGPALMKQGRNAKCALNLLNSDGLEVEVEGNIVDVETAPFEQAPGTLPPLFTGTRWMDTVGAWDRERALIVRRIRPQPATVRAIMVDQKVSQHGGMNT